MIKNSFFSNIIFFRINNLSNTNPYNYIFQFKTTQNYISLINQMEETQ